LFDCSLAWTCPCLIPRSSDRFNPRPSIAPSTTRTGISGKVAAACPQPSFFRLDHYGDAGGIHPVATRAITARRCPSPDVKCHGRCRRDAAPIPAVHEARRRETMYRGDRRSSIPIRLLLAAALLGVPLASLSAARAFHKGEVHRGSGACTKCNCDEFQGSGSFCIRSSCKHSYSSHKS
jgi:hypothetical protein